MSLLEQEIIRKAFKGVSSREDAQYVIGRVEKRIRMGDLRVAEIILTFFAQSPFATQDATTSIKIRQLLVRCAQ